MITARLRPDLRPVVCSRLHRTAQFGPPVDQELLYDVLDEVVDEVERTVPQVALNWLLRRPTVSSVIVGARNAEQLRQNLGAVGWALTSEQVTRLDAVSNTEAPYPHFPYRRQAGFARLDPPMAG
ncbi:aldo/keto reductase [Propionibacteriaceae bacterium Y2011]